jgi:hypothetical protein
MNSYKNKTKYKTSLPTNLMLKVKITKKQNKIIMYNSQNNLILNEEFEKQKTNRKIKKIMLLNGQIKKKT